MVILENLLRPKTCTNYYDTIIVIGYEADPFWVADPWLRYTGLYQWFSTFQYYRPMVVLENLLRPKTCTNYYDTIIVIGYEVTRPQVENHWSS